MTARFVMVGGFLGAGKTTALGRLARLYQSQGKRVGVVTNDQAHDLVDTNTFRGQGIAVEEVPGACFCCRFDDLVGRVGALEASERPDVILAEPVGSCTDLVATVVQPLKDLYAGRFEVAPYAVLFKPSHGIRILRNQSAGGFSPKAAYIFKKQLEEADAIVINRIDELDPPAIEELSRLLGEQFPGTPVLRVSATTGAGFDALAELLDQTGAFGRKILDIDYDTYAEGEAELGWLNATARLTSDAPFDLDALLTAILGDLATVCRALGGEVAHLKLIGMDDASAFAVGNVISSDTAPKLSLPSGLRPREADLIVNARVAIDPAVLEAEVKRVVAVQCALAGVIADFRTSQSLRPGRPVPTHRYTEAKN
ncbi:cobalamin biosynthesis protein P47K [Gemmata sp. G18]|uniref:Cobalamin biosynthesis protein P47K n=1 Tax=Gemmata palustris TaxID=2822762 RepID=A0ABS5BQU6_9BACT|nr:GTP-binding protein [Gemmata palustris]MBP3955243.1 cobalamin biosynthesis protein P47K [Gemmata palustris]